MYLNTGDAGMARARTQLEQLPHIVQGVNNIDPSVHLEATTQFRQLLTIERTRRSRW